MRPIQRQRQKRFPETSVILLAILLAVMAATWLFPAVSYTMVQDETGRTVIDQASVTFSSAEAVYPWHLPDLLLNGVESVLSTLVLISVSNGAFVVLNASGMFSALIGRLCLRFRRREGRLIFAICTAFSLLGLIVIPHCFIGFVPLMVQLAVQLGYDPLVGLGMVLFGATTASMTGPFSAVTAMCQQSVGLPVYSGIGVRFVFFLLFHLINAAYLLRYAKRIQKPAAAVDAVRVEGEAPPLSRRQQAALAAFGLVLAFIACGSIFFGFNTADISALFFAFALLAGPILGICFSDTMRHFAGGIRDSATTILVISLAGTVTEVLRQSGLFDTLLYFSSSLISALPSFLVPLSLLILVEILNCLLPSGPAKGMLLMPLLGPVGQMAGVSLQTSVLTYTLGDSFSNYLLPYDSTTASYLAAAKIPFQTWVRFVAKLFLIWNAVGAAGLTVLYFVGYGPF